MSEENAKEEISQGKGNTGENKAVGGLYENWFLDYASYVILERAVPAIEDGFKPVQRRILHAMNEMHDGRFHKVANIIGQTMQYHPHGDAAIGDALVNLGQKELLIDCQGNWGDVRTGDRAAASRYIEARLSKFALEVLFNPQTTKWQLSYDGRKREPLTLPAKFPMLLAQGVEGIAVGLATKILPHNFIELIDASILYLEGKTFELYPDFITGGSIDITNYSQGKRGGKVRVRAKIEELDKKTLLIKDVPYGTTTGSLIDSIIKANDQNKIKIKKVIDNTAENVEIEIQLAPNVSPNVTIDALYAFTDCEVSISPNCCVIINDKPLFLGVDEVLKLSTDATKELLKQELLIRLRELDDKWHYSSLEKIFIENRIYRDIEECETWEEVLQTIDKGLDPYKGLLMRTITQEDIIRLTEIKIKRISKFDSFKADELIKAIEDEMAEVKHNLEHLTDYSINYFKNLKTKFGKGKERKTEIRTFDTINATEVVVANQKLYINREEGFVGYGLKKDEYICDCSDIDDIIVFLENGKFVVTRISDKAFVGKKIVHADVWKKSDEYTIYNVIYIDGENKVVRAKRFAVTAITRDREYSFMIENKLSKLLYFSVSPNSESEKLQINLSPASKARKKQFDFDFADIAIKGRSSQGNIITKHAVRKIIFKEKGVPTLGGRAIYYDEVVGRINTDGRGRLLGQFQAGDEIIAIHKNGTYRTTDFELSNHYLPEDEILVAKLNRSKPVNLIYFEGESKTWYAKSFLVETTTLAKAFSCITEHKNSKILWAMHGENPTIELIHELNKAKETLNTSFEELTEIRGYKALGTKLPYTQIVGIKLAEGETSAEIETEEIDE
jgi:topoisomerase-4 subunit A